MSKEIVLTAIDVETTGFEPEKGHRITEVGLIVYKLNVETMELKQAAKVSTLVNPKRDIPAVVQNITGITPSMVKDKITWEDLSYKISKIMCITDIFVAHNADFDSMFITHELMRVDLPFNLDMVIFCTMQEGRFATPLGKVPKLKDLCWSLDVEFKEEDAHRAIYDTEKMVEALKEGIDRGYFDLKEAVNTVLSLKKEKAA